MKRELEQKLIERWPTWFDINGNMQHTLMPLGFQHGDGWFNLLWRLCENLEPLVAEFEKGTAHRFQVLQVKEKFGGLRFYVRDADDGIRQRIEHTEMESSKICEVCGKAGLRRSGAWISTLCDEHADERARSKED